MNGKKYGLKHTVSTAFFEVINLIKKEHWKWKQKGQHLLESERDSGNF